MKSNRRRFLRDITGGIAGAGLVNLEGKAQAGTGAAFISVFPRNINRTFIGPEYWANRLQDWRVRNGRIECVDKRPESPMRTLHLLTHRIGINAGDFTIRVQTGPIDGGPVASDAATGFLIGVGGEEMDYRGAAIIHHQPGPGGGIFAGCDVRGNVFFRDFEKPLDNLPVSTVFNGALHHIKLELIAGSVDSGTELSLVARDITGKEISRKSIVVESHKLTGSVALVSHPGTGSSSSRYWFREWQVSGERIAADQTRTFGPVMSTLYTVHGGVLKLTAQLAPVGDFERQTADLEVRPVGSRAWQTVVTTKIRKAGWTAPFRVEKWDSSRDYEYRVRYFLKGPGIRPRPHYWNGRIKRDPVNKETIVVASLSCVQQIDGAIGQRPTYAWKYRAWFPHADMTPNLKKHNADLYFFAGDQIYEGNPTRIVRNPPEEAELDYLYKWYLWCWAFGDTVRDTPCICIPDDHDVYHGNIWGMGGRASAPDDPAGLLGGYGMPPEWLNMIQRTQTSHLPDPYDPAPVEQSVGVYYTQLVWGGIGFAIFEDRKFKSSPAIVKAEKTRDSHIIEKDYDTHKADLSEAKLLGERQLKFLHEFSKDWRGQQMKAALSQTIFCNLQISSRPPTTGELDKDLDSNGWPQSGRNAALRELRRGFMVHLAGDQHLASALQHGIDEFGDACWSLCSPSIANLYTRFWNPDYGPVNPGPDLKPFMGDYEDGFHNRITVYAVANPVNEPRPGQFPDPVDLHRKATGYNIVRFDKAARTITLETWPRYVDPSTGKQYEGWPITIKQTDNYGRKANAWLPILKVSGLTDPVVQVVEESSGEIIYTLRIKGTELRPKVFSRGKYTVHLGEPGSSKFKSLTGIEALNEDDMQTIQVNL